jgi:tartrate-resistant acid phosphatase type 5
MPRVPALLSLLLAAITLHPPAPVVELPVRNDRLRIAVVGDIGDGPLKVFEGMQALHAAEPFDAVIIPGDNFYPCGVASETDTRWNEIRNTLSTLGIPIYPVLGNHDYGQPKLRAKHQEPCGDADPEAQIRASSTVANWVFPARTYRVHSSIADFSMVDTSPIAYAARTPMLGSDTDQGVSSDLTAMLAASSGWKIVTGHNTIVSSGYHGYFPRWQIRHMRTILPVLRRAGTDLYICGHDHHLELIPGKPMYLISGAGSEPVPAIAGHDGSVLPFGYRPAVGFAVLELTPRELRVRFYDAKGREVGKGYRKRK